jgi:NADH-quinone oxidoreductase subunit N
MNFDTSKLAQDLGYLVPYLILVITGMVLVLAEAFYRGKDRSGLMSLAVAGSIASAIASIVLYRQLPEAGGKPLALLGDMLVADRTAYVLSALFAVTTALAALASPAHQREHDWQIGEYYGVMLLSASGMVILAHAWNLVTVFLGIETMSLGVYVMCAMRRRSKRGNEAAMKYFLIGAFATGFLLYGMALLYGAAGTSSLLKMQTALTQSANPGLVVAGAFLLVVAFGFKVAAVPFHMWAPDVYEGSPTPVTAFLSVGSKAASFAMLIRIFVEGLPAMSADWRLLFWVLSIVTMTVGNVAAVTQTNVKRMLAYSSIGHAGYILLGVLAGNNRGIEGFLFYLLAYALTNLGAFAVLMALEQQGEAAWNMSDFAGLWGRRPWLAAAMAICMFSLAGVPPTIGFVGKFYVFTAAWQAGLAWLALIAVITSAIAAFFYLRIVVQMFMREPVREVQPIFDRGLALGIGLATLGILIFGIIPTPVIDLVQKSLLPLGR